MRTVAVATSIELKSSPNPSRYGEPVTLTAVVTSSSGAPPDGETVSFMRGPILLGRATLRGGEASFTTTNLETGTYSIRLIYHGDSEFESSRRDEPSASLSHTVE